MSTTTGPASVDTPRQLPQLVPGVSHLEWDTFRSYFAAAWHPGEHVTFLGHTGSGKTTLAVNLLDLRPWVVALGVKPKDDTLTRLVREQGWKHVKRWKDRPRPRHGATSERLVLWPPFRTMEDEVELRGQMHEALAEMFREGNRTVFADELFILATQLGCAKLLERYWTLGRSVGLTVVGGSQRPAHIPLLAYDQASHLFVWRDNDDTNVRRLAGLGGLHSALVRRTVPRLPRHVALYMNTRTGEMATTQAPAPDKRGGRS